MIWNDFGTPKSSQNQILDIPNCPQGTPGVPPGRARGQKGFPNSIVDGLGFIFDGFWKDLATNMDRKVIPKHTTAASGLLILYPRPLITQPPSLKLLNGLILKHFLHHSTLHGCNPFMSTTTMHRTLQHSEAPWNHSQLNRHILHWFLLLRFANHSESALLITSMPG